jgi:DNA-binding response OmpR family regulator
MRAVVSTSAWSRGTARHTGTRPATSRRRPAQQAHDPDGPGSLDAVPVHAPFHGYDDLSVRTVLVVDDEPEIVRILRDYLERAGFAVVTASDGETAVATAHRHRPALVLLDLTLPGLDGLEVARALRRDGEVPIIMLTARTEETDRIVGLELGADDYVAKPFSPREVVARVRAVLRRADATHVGADVVRVGESMELHVPSMETTVAGRRVELTATEFQLLLHMARQPGRVFTRAQLLDAVHGVAVESYERAIDAHVKNIRRKIEEDPHAPRRLKTVFGVGYRLTEGS